MSLAGDLVDGVMRAITGGVEMTAAARAAAKQSVREVLAAAKGRDQRELLSVQADAIEQRHLERVRKIAGAVVPIGVHADAVEDLLAHPSGPGMAASDRESIEALIAHARAGDVG